MTIGNISSVSLTCDGRFRINTVLAAAAAAPITLIQTAADEVSAPRGGVVSESNARVTPPLPSSGATIHANYGTARSASCRSLRA